MAMPPHDIISWHGERTWKRHHDDYIWEGDGWEYTISRSRGSGAVDVAGRNPKRWQVIAQGPNGNGYINGDGGLQRRVVWFPSATRAAHAVVEWHGLIRHGSNRTNGLAFGLLAR